MGSYLENPGLATQTQRVRPCCRCEERTYASSATRRAGDGTGALGTARMPFSSLEVLNGHGIY